MLVIMSKNLLQLVLLLVTVSGLPLLFIMVVCDFFFFLFNVNTNIGYIVFLFWEDSNLSGTGML